MVRALMLLLEQTDCWWLDYQCGETPLMYRIVLVSRCWCVCSALTACCLSCRDMPVEEAIELGRRAIYHATFRDCASGGTVSGK